ncbi:MAG: response regulator [Thermodesulfobacteriota bacterium]
MVEKETILVVDNEDAIRETLKKILEREGYRILTAKNGQEALDILREKRVQLIISDIVMPKIDGHKLLRLAKSIRPEIEVILMTGHGQTEQGLEAIKEGAFDFIQKPFTKLALFKTVKQALEKQAMGAEIRYLKERIRELISEILEVVGEPPKAAKALEYNQGIGAATSPH